MDWQFPYLLLFILPALALLFWADSRSQHPMSPLRRRLLLLVRTLLVILGIAALAGPARVERSARQTVFFLLDHSRSMGPEGLKRVEAKAQSLYQALPTGVEAGWLAFGSEAELLQEASPRPYAQPLDPSRLDQIGAQSNLAGAVELAQGLFPAGVSRHVVLVTDGLQTQGDLKTTAREAAVNGLRIHAAPVAGEKRPDVRVTTFASSQTQLHEGASLDLTAQLEGSIAGQGIIKLYENGLEVERRDLELKPGEIRREVFKRIPNKRNIYNYRVALEGFAGDTIPENNDALAIVDVRGKPLLLYVEGEEGESHYLTDAMAREGIRLDVRNGNSMPRTLRELSAYDGVILSDVPAHVVGEPAMIALKDYVDQFGGGLIMIGGMNSFGVGGYYRTPIEEILPVKLKAPDQEEQMSSALAVVIDRSGSMSGEKLELAKSASAATAEILTKKDFIGVYAFDSEVHVIVPMARVLSPASVAGQISTISPGGGTNIYPGMMQARQDLSTVEAKVKHMIVLTDGQSSGSGYEALASQCRGEGITVSTVAVGGDADTRLLQAIATNGGGQFYVTADPAALTRIFTQDTMVHMGRMIREEAFEPQKVERHPMLKDWDNFTSPPLLGYVKTIRRSTAQVPLVTDLGDPLLAHGRYGLGKVTCFTSDCKSRWASLWVTRWEGYGKLWAQIFRETARAPQGQNMDLRLAENSGNGSETIFLVDLLEDAGTRRNDAEVKTDIYHVPANALGSSLRLVATKTLQQTGPGLYSSSFRPDQPGAWLLRARAGAQMVSAGFVHNPSGEVATGGLNEDLLREAARLTQGVYLDGDKTQLDFTAAQVPRYIELWPWLLWALLGGFLADVVIRRWEHVLGLWESVQGIKAAKT